MDTNLKVAELETRVGELPLKITNRLEVQEGDTTVIYEATAYDLLDTDAGVGGNARLTRTDSRTENKRIFVSYLPPKTELAPVESTEEVWYVGFIFDSFDNFVTSDGEVNTSKEGYRESLKEDAVDKGLRLTDKLLGEVFAPIDKKLIDFYKKLHLPE